MVTRATSGCSGQWASSSTQQPRRRRLAHRDGAGDADHEGGTARLAGAEERLRRVVQRTEVAHVETQEPRDGEVDVSDLSEVQLVPDAAQPLDLLSRTVAAAWTPPKRSRQPGRARRTATQLLGACASLSPAETTVGRGGARSGSTPATGTVASRERQLRNSSTGPGSDPSGTISSAITTATTSAGRIGPARWREPRVEAVTV